MKVRRCNERGFTLIELLTVVGLLGVLAYLSLANFYIYRASAAYGSVESTLHNARVAAEGSQTDPEHLPAAVDAFQNTQGSMTDANEYLPGFKVPSKTRVWASYDPNCAVAAEGFGGEGCITDFIEVQHCQALLFAVWVRWGDGYEFVFRNLPGGGGWC